MDSICKYMFMNLVWDMGKECLMIFMLVKYELNFCLFYV